MRTDIELWQVALSLVLVGLVLGVSLWQRLALERSILWAAARATVQLLLVGVFFAFVFESSLAGVWSALWVAAMVAIAGGVIARRTGAGRRLLVVGVGSLALTVGVVLLVIFGLQILPLESVSVVVIAGITIGNTMPTVVQAVGRTRSQLKESAGEIEAMLALGFDGSEAMRRVVQEVTKLALIPQIERTKVVGLIALPGAMTGLLLAGVDPLDAVMIQLVVMFLVLGSVALATIMVTMAMTRQALTADLRLAEWARARAS